MLKSSIEKIILLFTLWIIMPLSLEAQSLSHPVIFAESGDRENVISLIDENDWAQNLLSEVQQFVDDQVVLHQKDPSKILRKIPKIIEDDTVPELEVTTVRQHAKILAQASYAGLLYYLYEEEKYAQFAADILWYYADELARRKPEQTSICGNGFYDPRATYLPWAIAYDFIYNYLKRAEAKVYSKADGRYIAHNHQVMQKALLNMVGNGLQEYGPPDRHGRNISNHPVLKAPGVLFGILCVEDDQERERLFQVFWEDGTNHQNSFKHTILNMFGSQGIWPESTSYSFMPNVTMLLNIIDRIKPEMNVVENNLDILKGNFLFDYIRLPDHRFVSYGDSHRGSGATNALYRYTLNLADRRGYEELAKKASQGLRQHYPDNNGFSSRLIYRTWDNTSAFTRLLWAVPLNDTNNEPIDFNKPTVIIEHAGIALQRNYGDDNNELYGLCGIIGGAHYVHSHLTGISMELYGAGYVMAPNGGLPGSIAERRIPLHEHYFRLYAGTNTVIVNGTSHGLDEGSWKPRAHVWQNRVVNIAAEPGHLEDPVNENFNFATQLLNDEVNNAVQQRTLSIIRTSPTTAYYFDLFRSKSLENNKFHDYVYHNIGDQASLILGDNKNPKLKKTDRYNNDIGDVVHSPGWKYFEKTRTTAETKSSVKVRFDLKYDHKYMHMFVPGGVSRAYTQALAPASRDVRNGYNEKKTQVLVIRQQGAAWDQPYISIFEPSTKKESAVKSVENLYSGSKIVGAKVISETDGKVYEDYIISHEESNQEFALPEIDLYFRGRFGVARMITENDLTEVELYIGEGELLKFKGNSLEGSGGE